MTSNEKALPLNRPASPESASKINSYYIHFLRKIQPLICRPDIPVICAAGIFMVALVLVEVSRW